MIRKLTNSKALFQSIKSRLKLNDNDEVHAMALGIMEKYYRLSITDILSEKEVEEVDFTDIIQRLNQHEPLQYVLGEADFCGRKFKVNSSVLIPRPETELLIREVLNHHPVAPRILDIGTGSGCIAISLKLEIPSAKVFGLDISEEALRVANENAKTLNAEVEFINRNFLHEFSIDPVDIIVSNPPYVCEVEKVSMGKNVLDYEPHQALFVPNNDPLLFYRVIGKRKQSLLRSNGKVFVEINERLGKEVKELFETAGFNSVQIIKDLDRKDRIVVATLQ